jgi:hypothetical protein
MLDASDSASRAHKQAKQLRAAIRAAQRAREEAKLAYQFNPSSYTHGSLAQIELALARLQEIEL